MNVSISTIMFDFGGVLVDLDMQACVDAFARIGVKNVEQYIGKYSQIGLFLDMESGKISAEEFRAELRRMFQLSVTDAQIDEAWNAFLIGIPEYKLHFLQKLRRQYHVIMLSNTNDIHFGQALRKEFSKLGGSIDMYFDHCYLSYQIGMVKPNKDIFHYVLDQEKTSPEKILFLDDGAKNIEMAKQLGFSTYLVKEREDFRSLFD